MELIMDRKNKDVVLYQGDKEFSFQINDQESALGAIGSLACTLEEGDRIEKTHIVRKDGTIKPRLVTFPFNVCNPETIDARILYDPEEAERLRWEVVSHIRDVIRPQYEKAWEDFMAVEIGHYQVPDGTNPYKYQTYYRVEYDDGSKGGISWRWIKKRPRTMLNEEICKAYVDIQDLLDQWHSHLYNYNEIVNRAIQNAMPHRYWEKRDALNEHMIVFEMNGRKYLYLWSRKGGLPTKFHYPGPWDEAEVVETVTF